MNRADIIRIADHCRSHLDLANAKLSDEYYYHSLPLCVVDTVFSIGVRYTSTQNTVRRFAAFAGIPVSSRTRLLEVEQLSIRDLICYYDEYSIEGMVERVFQNRQRTSSRNGILKAEAVLLFAQVLAKHHVNYFQDVEKVMGNPAFEESIAKIPGHGSGISARYFYMLAGSDDYIKPDRMIQRFIFSAIRRNVGIEECQLVIAGACKELSEVYPDLTPRALDYLIWQYQREQ